MKKLFKYVAVALVVALTFSTASVSAYAYTPTDLKNLSYTTTYYKDSSKMPTFSSREDLFWNHKRNTREDGALYDFVYKNVKGNVSTGNVLCVVSNVEKKGCLAKGTVIDPMGPNYIAFLGADGKQLCGTKYPIVAELDNDGNVTYRVSDNALFRGNTEIISIDEYSSYGVRIKYKIYGSQVVPGYEIKIGNYVGKNLSNNTIHSTYQLPYNEFSYDIWDDEKNYTYGEACFSIPLDERAGKTMNITFNGVKVDTYRFDS